MRFDSLKEKCEYYKNIADIRLTPNSYILFHLDGRSFSKKVKNKFAKPFDPGFVSAMDATMKHLCVNVPGVRVAYCQSDEISLVMLDSDIEGLGSTSYFGFRMCKLLSVTASMATGMFNKAMLANRLSAVGDGADVKARLLGSLDTSPLYEFDCKVWNVPSANDAYAWLLYRQHDCVRNSKQQVCQTYLSHSALKGLDTDKQVALLQETHGVDWDTFPNGLKYGRLCCRREVVKTSEEYGEFLRNEWLVEEALPFDKDTDGSGTEILRMIEPQVTVLTETQERPEL